MSALAQNPPEIPMAQDDYFQALEERVLNAVELLKREREQRAAAEERAEHLARREEEQMAQVIQLEDELSSLKKERDAVRQRVERLLKQLEEV
jgi:transcription initiation factor IIF auxiliary subunit